MEEDVGGGYSVPRISRFQPLPQPSRTAIPTQPTIPCGRYLVKEVFGGLNVPAWFLHHIFVACRAKERRCLYSRAAPRLSFLSDFWVLSAILLSPHCFWRRYETWPGACRFLFGVNGLFQEEVARKSFLTNYGKIFTPSALGNSRLQLGAALPITLQHLKQDFTSDSPKYHRAEPAAAEEKQEYKDFLPQLRVQERHSLHKRFGISPVVIQPLVPEGCLTGSVLKAPAGSRQVPRCSSLGQHQGAPLAVMSYFELYLKHSPVAPGASTITKSVC